MTHTTDDVIQTTARNADEQAWDRAQQTKRRKLPDPPAMPAEPCCGRCQYWVPEKDSPYGRCGQLVITTQRVWRVSEKGIVLDLATAVKTPDLIFESLRTAAGFAGCGNYQEALT